MKTYKAIAVKGTEMVDLYCIEKPMEFLPGAPDEFVDGEIISEDQIVMEEAPYVDDQGVGTMLFAFKK